MYYFAFSPAILVSSFPLLMFLIHTNFSLSWFNGKCLTNNTLDGLPLWPGSTRHTHFLDCGTNILSYLLNISVSPFCRLGNQGSEMPKIAEPVSCSELTQFCLTWAFLIIWDFFFFFFGHPCAGAILIFSVSFQFQYMHCQSEHNGILF